MNQMLMERHELNMDGLNAVLRDTKQRGKYSAYFKEITEMLLISKCKSMIQSQKH